MAALVPPVPDERTGLLAYLAQQRHAVRVTCYGLDDEQARATPTASPLSVGGLVKHLVHMERDWARRIVPPGGAPVDEPGSADDYEEGFVLGPGETLAGVLAEYERVAADTERVVASVADLGQPVPVPRDAPWFPADVEAWSVRWVLLHLIEETARHAGHADIVREHVDGATGFALLAAAEGWPATPWLQPWQPAAGRHPIG